MNYIVIRSLWLLLSTFRTSLATLQNNENMKKYIMSVYRGLWVQEARGIYKYLPLGIFGKF